MDSIMSNGYKAPSGLGSAVRGRSMVRRDYTAGVKADRQERLAEEAVVQSGLGLIQGIAGGVAQVSSAIGENIKSWEQAEAGARTVFEGSGLEGTFEESGYQGADNWMDRWFKSAGEEVKTQTIGGKEFSVADLMNVGRADSVAATRMGTAIKDESGTITGYKSLYESIGTDTETASRATAEIDFDNLVVLGGKPNESDGTTVIENNNQQEQKQNAVTPKNNKNKLDFAFTYKGEEVDFSDFFSNLFGKEPNQTEDAIVAERLKRMKEGSLSTSPTNSE